MRRITTRGGGEARLLSDLLQGLLIAELLAPSSELWVVSPWISDIAVIDNRSGQFRSVLPGLPARQIRFTEVLLELARRGCIVRVLMRDDEHNAPVRQRLTDVTGVNVQLSVTIVGNLHDKGLLSDRFHVHGSMNFTFFGRAVNEEGVTITADEDAIARARLDYSARFPAS